MSVCIVQGIAVAGRLLVFTYCCSYCLSEASDAEKEKASEKEGEVGEAGGKHVCLAETQADPVCLEKTHRVCVSFRGDSIYLSSKKERRALTGSSTNWVVSPSLSLLMRRHLGRAWRRHRARGRGRWCGGQTRRRR